MYVTYAIDFQYWQWISKRSHKRGWSLISWYSHMRQK